MERHPAEGIGYPLLFSRTSIVAQLVKNPPAMQETWILSLRYNNSSMSTCWIQRSIMGYGNKEVSHTTFKTWIQFLWTSWNSFISLNFIVIYPHFSVVLTFLVGGETHWSVFSVCNETAIRFRKAYWQILKCLQNYHYVKGGTLAVLQLEPGCQNCLKMKDAIRDALFTGVVKALEKQAWSAVFALKHSFTATQIVPLLKWKLLINLALYSFHCKKLFEGERDHSADSGIALSLFSYSKWKND